MVGIFAPVRVDQDVHARHQHAVSTPLVPEFRQLRRRLMQLFGSPKTGMENFSVFPCELPAGEKRKRRRAEFINSLKVVPDAAAFCLASRKRGSSMISVVRIQTYIDLYYWKSRSDTLIGVQVTAP